MTKKALYSTSEAAVILRLSRIEVFRKIRAGKLKAEKIGRNYVIPHDALIEALGKMVGTSKRTDIDKAIDRALREYRETFERLAKE